MTEHPHGAATSLEAFTDADAALARVAEIYHAATAEVRQQFGTFLAGKPLPEGTPACYPYVGIVVEQQEVNLASELSYGKLPGPGVFGTTLTRPDLFDDYYREQFELLLENHAPPLWVGVSDRPIPLPFVIEEATAELTTKRVQALRGRFPLPELSRINDAVANGT